MEDNKPVEEGVVVLNGGGDLSPPGRGDRRGIEEGGEFVEGVTHMARIGGGWGAETWKVVLGRGIGHHRKGFWKVFMSKSLYVLLWSGRGGVMVEETAIKEANTKYLIKERNQCRRIKE